LSGATEVSSSTTPFGKGKDEKGVERLKTPHTGVARYFEADRERGLRVEEVRGRQRQRGRGSRAKGQWGDEGEMRSLIK